uniref:Uncharacterized protein n=1 Tax=Anguilla anguilla TaxID=7936 RepID=A0A0E9S829_ANGAN
MRSTLVPVLDLMMSRAHWFRKTYWSSVWTMRGLCMRRSWTTPYTSTMLSCSIWKINRSMAMKVPVRPTPALQCTTVGE